MFYGKKLHTSTTLIQINKILSVFRSLLATEKNGLDPMRLVNNYQELTNESFFDVIREVGFKTVTDFCNDNLDCIDYVVSGYLVVSRD